MLVGGLAVPADASAAAPDNDNFTDARTLVPGVASTGSTAEATLEPGEPVHSGADSGGSVWFRWTANATGTVRLDACAANFWTEVAVYGGSTLDATLFSTRVAGAQGGCETSSGSYVVFRAAAGHEYRIVLAGWSQADKGEYSLVLTADGATPAPPANDDRTNATVISGASPDSAGTNADATTGWNEWSATGTQNVWWTWTSPVDGQAAVDLCGSSFDTRLGVMRETQDGFVGEATNDDACGDRSSLVFNAVKGTRYLIGVGGRHGTVGTIALKIRAGDDTTAPASTFTKFPATVDGHRVATFEWEVSEAPYTVECSLDAAPWGSCDNKLYQLSEDDHVYRLRASDQYGNVEDPPLEYHWRVEQPTPPNDNFADALTLVNGQALTVNNGDATAEEGEPGHDPYYGTSAAPSRSVWFKFTAVGGLADLDFCQIDWPAVWALYTGSGLQSLVKFTGGYTYEDCQDSMYVSPGTTYYLAVDGQSSSIDLGTGPITVLAGGDAIGTGPTPTPTATPTPTPTATPTPTPRPTATPTPTLPAGRSRTYTVRVEPATRRALCASPGSRVQVIASGGTTRVRRRATLVCR